MLEEEEIINNGKLKMENGFHFSIIFNTIFHFPLSIFNSLSICWGRNPNLQLGRGQGGGWSQ